MPYLPRVPDSTFSFLFLILLTAFSCATPSLGDSSSGDTGVVVPGEFVKTMSPFGAETVDHEVLDLPKGGDRVLARAKDILLRESDLSSFLKGLDPLLYTKILHSLLYHVLAGKVARDEGIEVSAKDVDWFFKRRLERDKLEARRVYGPKGDIEDLAADRFGMTPKRYLKWLRRHVETKTLINFVVAYTAMKEGRVRCRIMSLPTKNEAERISRKIRDGADFQVLAKRHSLDPTSAKGGEIPSFSRDHPVLGKAFDLKEGEISNPIPGPLGDRQVWYLILMLERIPGRKVSFEEAKSGILRQVKDNPLRPEEFLSFLGSAAGRYGLMLTDDPLEGPSSLKGGDSKSRKNGNGRD